jgi:hypothetical protein
MTTTNNSAHSSMGWSSPSLPQTDRPTLSSCSYGISCNNDSVLRSVFFKYLHPKEVFIAEGILVPDIARKKVPDPDSSSLLTLLPSCGSELDAPLQLTDQSKRCYSCCFFQGFQIPSQCLSHSLCGHEAPLRLPLRHLAECPAPIPPLTHLWPHLLPHEPPHRCSLGE